VRSLSLGGQESGRGSAPWNRGTEQLERGICHQRDHARYRARYQSRARRGRALRRHAVYLALSDQVAGLNGCYFDENQAVRPASGLANDVVPQEVLWTQSERWVGP